MARAKNTATDEQVKKLLRSNLTGLGDAYKSADMEHVISAYESFLLDFLEVSTRLLAHQVERCAMQAFEKTESAEANMFGRQLSAAMSFARTKMKAVTSGAKTHPSVLRVIHALGRLEAGAPGNRDAPRRATSRPTSSGVRCSPSAAAPLPISSALVAVPPESPRRPADIYQLYGVRVPSADEVEVVSSESSSPPRKSARVAAGKVEDTKDSGFALQYYDKEKQVYITVKKDGASKEHPVSKGPNGFLTTKVYGRLKELDVPNLALGQSTSAAPTTSGSAKKKQPKKRPAAATTKSMAAGATSSATASALDPAVAGRNNAIKLGPISVTCAAEQACLQHKIDGKKRLVAACTKSKASTLTISHSEVIKKLLPFAELEGATKESVLRQRDIIFRDHAKPSM